MEDDDDDVDEDRADDNDVAAGLSSDEQKSRGDDLSKATAVNV
jgi:hypothetical protein